MSVSFEELAGSPTLEVREGKILARRVFRVAWSDALAFLSELWGSYRSVGGVYVYSPPAYYPGVPQAIVSQVHIEPFDRHSPAPGTLTTLVSDTNSYTGGARVVAEYTSLDDRDRVDAPAVPQGTILRFSADVGFELIRLPGRVWKWDTAAAPELEPDVDPGMVVPVEDLRLSWERVPLPPWNAIRDLRGKLNSGTFLGHAAETVMFMGTKVQRDFQIVDTGLWKINYHFKVREVTSTVSSNVRFGWNHFYRRTGDGNPPEHWLRIKNADGSFLYGTADFAPLFAFA